MEMQTRMQKVLMDHGQFDKFYRAAVLFSTPKSNFLYLQSQKNKDYVIYIISPEGKLGDKTDQGELNYFFDENQNVYDPVTKIQYICGISKADHFIELMPITSDGKLDKKNTNSINYAADSQQQALTAYMINNVVYLYEQKERNMEWEINRYNK